MNLRTLEKKIESLEKYQRRSHEAIRTLLALAAHNGQVVLRDDAGPTLEDGLWAGRPIVVLGSGPSMRDFDYSRLDGHLVIAVNRQGESCSPAVWFSVDSRWLLWTLDGTLGADARSKLQSTKALRVLRRNQDFVPPPGWVEISEARGDRWTDSLDCGLGSIGNSGYAALHLAALLGGPGAQIYVAGIDMRGDGASQAWSHEPYPVVTSEADAYPFFVYAFKEFAAPACAEKGITVRCLTPSALDFPMGDLPPASTPHFVTSWTPNGRYRELAERLSRNLQRWGLRHEIVALPDSGSWARNCAAKPRVVGEAMDRHPGEPVVWLDADALVRRFPHLLCDSSDWDVAYHIKDTVELLSGTLAFSGSPLSREICRAWQAECSANPDTWDQVSLAATMSRFPQARVRLLPAEYCCISDTMAPHCGDIVVEHFQASRRSDEARSKLKS